MRPFADCPPTARARPVVAALHDKAPTGGSFLLVTTPLTESLAAIDRGLTVLGRSALISSWRPGQSPARVRDLLARRGMKSVGELEGAFAWHDGIDFPPDVPADDFHVFPGFYMLSLDDAVASYDTYVSERRWNPGGLPLFATGGGDFYVVDLSEFERGSVRHFRIEESEHPVEFATVSAFFATLAAAFKEGLFFLDSTGYLEMDDPTFGELAARLNPGISWWTESI